MASARLPVASTRVDAEGLERNGFLLAIGVESPDRSKLVLRRLYSFVDAARESHGEDFRSEWFSMQ